MLKLKGSWFFHNNFTPGWFPTIVLFFFIYLTQKNRWSRKCDIRKYLSKNSLFKKEKKRQVAVIVGRLRAPLLGDPSFPQHLYYSYY
ncbi:hypothetical protein BpHYR1_024337 [Brachionus plicatilis]|uniref:Uncharacterized protein n=1 Tax=Brachionus plicatilis TaxID=10195 RepID=A0A3M7QAG7_BRAPC|nr:hypothetical protein BpHYR1_024337 [Brachionus plicatilis]